MLKQTIATVALCCASVGCELPTGPFGDCPDIIFSCSGSGPSHSPRRPPGRPLHRIKVTVEPTGPLPWSYSFPGTGDDFLIGVTGLCDSCHSLVDTLIGLAAAPHSRYSDRRYTTIGVVVPGEYEVTLSNVPPNCDVVGTNPRRVMVVEVIQGGRAEAEAAFDVLCTLTGNVRHLRVTTHTTGAVIPDSLLVLVGPDCTNWSDRIASACSHYVWSNGGTVISFIDAPATWDIVMVMPLSVSWVCRGDGALVIYPWGGPPPLMAITKLVDFGLATTAYVGFVVECG